MKKTTAEKVQEWTAIEEYTRPFGDYSLEALQLESKEKGIPIICLLLEFMNSYCDDEF